MSNEEYKTLSLECIRIEQEVYEQRIFQESKFPNQVLPYVWDNGRADGWRGREAWPRKADIQKRANDRAIVDGTLDWADVLFEELAEAFAEEDTLKMREELIQLAALCFRVISQIDRESE